MLSFKTIAPFLVTERSSASRLITYAGLGAGILLLLCSLQMYINLDRLIREKNIKKDGFDYVSVSKVITNSNMGKDNRFTQAEVERFKQEPFIEDAAPLISNQFRAMINAGNIIPFSTDIFLESIKEDFLDTLPPNFTWRPGQKHVPVIFSSDYLEMYNIFAPSQDLPQLSAESIGAVNIILECSGPGGIHTFTAGIVAMSDRINSVLVPESFLSFANKNIGYNTQSPAARIFIKTKDANNTAFIKYIEDNGLRINKDKMRFGRIKGMLQGVVSGLGVFAMLVVLLSLMLFSFYLKLMVARSRENLQLLMTLGYSPRWLEKAVSKKWLPVYAIITAGALAATAILQVIFQKSVDYREGITALPSGYTFMLAIVVFLLSVLINRKTIRNLLSGIQA